MSEQKTKPLAQMNREELLVVARQRGASEKDISLLSAPRLRAFLKGSDRYSRSSRQSRVSRRSRRSVRHDTHMARANPEVERANLQQWKLQQRAASVDNDDARTVVDTSYVASTNNRSDERFERVKQLVAMRNHLKNRIQKNLAVGQKNKDVWEEDTMEVHKSIVQRDQEFAKQVMDELLEHYRYFVDTCEEKEEQFKVTLSEYEDSEDQMMLQHMKRKLENMRKYIVDMKQEVDL